MIHRKHFDDALAVIEALEERRAKLGISDSAMERRCGVARSSFGKWRSGDRQATLKSIIAAAAVLGLEIVLIERPSPSSTGVGTNSRDRVSA